MGISDQEVVKQPKEQNLTMKFCFLNSDDMRHMMKSPKEFCKLLEKGEQENSGKSPQEMDDSGFF